MAKIDRMVIQWIVNGCCAKIDEVLGGFNLKVFLTHRTGKNRQKPAKTGNKNTITNSKLKDLILMVMSSFN